METVSGPFVLFGAAGLFGVVFIFCVDLGFASRFVVPIRECWRVAPHALIMDDDFQPASDFCSFC
jgi:hypothetical protein